MRTNARGTCKVDQHPCIGRRHPEHACWCERPVCPACAVHLLQALCDMQQNKDDNGQVWSASRHPFTESLAPFCDSKWRKDKAARTGGPHFHLCACQVQWQKRRLQLWVFVQVHGMLVAGLAVMELQGTRSSMHCHWQAFTRSVSAGSTCSACTTACMPLTCHNACTTSHMPFTCHSTQIPGMHAELDLRKAKL